MTRYETKRIHKEFAENFQTDPLYKKLYGDVSDEILNFAIENGSALYRVFYDKNGKAKEFVLIPELSSVVG